MYREFFGLKENPFNVTSDPSFLFLSRVHKEAFAHLLYGIRERKGFLEITGEVGAGKTTLCRALLHQLDRNTKTAFVFNSTLPEKQLFQSILEDFGMAADKKNKISMLKQLHKFFLDEIAKGNNVVLIIDEAQNLKLSVLEEIRMLSNLETEKEKLLQIVLVGQPELKKKLELPELRQLRQRIVVRFHIPGMAEDEIREYIDHRLRIAGSDGGISFSEESVESVYKYTGGIPRVINLVCDKALLAAYVIETKDISLALIDRAINELEGRMTQ